MHVLKESKECKRLLDLKYNDLLFIINNIQTSVIFTSTVSGFLQATKKQFSISEVAVSIASISIATFISLILSISKYYALDDLKERIQLLREKYSLLSCGGGVEVNFRKDFCNFLNRISKKIAIPRLGGRRTGCGPSNATRNFFHEHR